MAGCYSASVEVAEVEPRFRRVIPRVDHNSTVVVADVTYEGSKLDVRGPLGDDERFLASAAEVANSVHAIFVLRDSLWNQQDHPYRQDGLCALMLSRTGSARRPSIQTHDR